MTNWYNAEPFIIYLFVLVAIVFIILLVIGVTIFADWIIERQKRKYISQTVYYDATSAKNTEVLQSNTARTNHKLNKYL